MLSAWEDFWFACSLHHVAQKETGQHFDYGVDPDTHEQVSRGPIRYWKEFRKYLLESVGRLESDLDEHRFGFTGVMCDPMREGELTRDIFNIPVRCFFPEAIFSWMTSSRRLYTLSADLQMLLNATSLDGVLWKDIKLPFSSFAIALPEPIPGDDGAQIDFLLVSPSPDGGTSILLVDRRVDNYRPLDTFLKAKLSKLLHRGRYQELGFELQRQVDPRVLAYTPDMTEMIGWTKDEGDAEVLNLVKEFQAGPVFAEFEDDPKAFTGKAINRHMDAKRAAVRIVAGMCLYLKTLPPSTPHVSNWELIKPKRGTSFSTVCQESQVCTVSTQFKLSPEERSEFSPGKVNRCFVGTVSPHFRTGHWRRPRGKGDDPEALRSVWVRPTIVGRDKLQPGQLPLGAEAILLGRKE